MNQHDQEFVEVKRLLKLKQHEVPPPGYFNNFSSQVISRIRAGESAQAQSWMERAQSEGGWFRQLKQIFEVRPGLMGGVATSVCLLFLLTVVFVERSEDSPNNLLTLSAPASPASSLDAATTASTAPTPATASLVAAAAPQTGGIMISTNPEASLQPNPMLFGQPSPSTPLFHFQTASFSPDGQ